MACRKKAAKQFVLPKAPVRRADDGRARLAQLGIEELDVYAGVPWAREVTS
jgi:hypothetical protein